MPIHPTLAAMLDHVLAELSPLARQVLDATQYAFQSNPKHFALKDAWTRRRGRFALEFETELRPQFVQLRQGAPLSAPSRGAFDGLSLVDERQALRDVGIAHVVELCGEASRTEIFQLGNFFTALNGGAVHGRDLNALRPAVFARALVHALNGPDLSAEGHYALVRVAAPGLAGALVPLYQTLVGLLDDADLVPLVSTRTGAQSPRRRETRDSQLGALADWHARSQGIRSQMAPLAPLLPDTAPSDSLLARLFERILADPALNTAVKTQLARLQGPIVRLSRDDPSLLRHDNHPTWRLINAVAAYAGGFSNAQDPRLDAFLRFLDEQTLGLLEAIHPSNAQFEGLLRQVDAFIARQARERSAPSQRALAALERAQQRGTWLQLLQEQLDAQAQVAGLDRDARRFLCGPWAEVVVHAMVQEGQDSAAAEQLVQVVDDLIDSLRTRRSAPEREHLRRTLPSVVTRIGAALNGASVPEPTRQTVMHTLMQLHAAQATGHGHTESNHKATPPADRPRDSEVGRLLDERDSEYASVWTHAKVDRATLPTQPLPLHDAAEAEQRNDAQRWLDQLQVGGWLHLFVGGGWETAQLVWIHPERRYFLFINQDGDARHSLTDGAVVQLYLNGLVMYLEQDGLVERAVGTLLQDLGA